MNEVGRRLFWFILDEEQVVWRSVGCGTQAFSDLSESSDGILYTPKVLSM